MYIKSLKLQNFRNYADESFAFDPAVNLICGENGQGQNQPARKLGGLLDQWLFRTFQKKRAAVPERESCFHLCGFSRAGARYFARAAAVARKAMEIYKNGVRQKRQSDAQGLLKTVLFCPEDRC